MVSPRWKQYHLSTAILLTLVAGILMGLNLKRDGEALAFHGWPLAAKEVRDEPPPPRKTAYNYDAMGWVTDVRGPQPVWKPVNILVDAIVSLGALAVVFFLSERRIHRRAVQTTKAPTGGEQK